jgi:NAD(P)-dependent dehydrogenase (short-subunit alcohol dehydrogenase family)
VLLHGRDRVKLGAALDAIHETTGNDRLGSYLADFASLRDVRRLAEEIIAQRERLDVLVNNAGIGTGPRRDERRVSADGYELRFQVNYLAAFLISRLLEPLLVRSAPSRIVNVTSAGQAEIDFDDVMLERDYSGVQAYCQSKLALVMLTLDLADELRPRGVTANCLHPGTFMPTNMVREAGVTPVDSLESGVQATLRLVADPGLDGVTGRYFDRTRDGRALAQAYDPDARRRVRELSVQLVAIQGSEHARTALAESTSSR